MKKISPLLIICLLFCNTLYATHLRAGEISIQQTAINSLTFRITITVFTNTIDTNVLFGGESEWLEFGDGTRVLVPETLNTERTDLGTGIGMASFTVLHTYPAFGNYVISYSEPNRNPAVLNMSNSVSARFYIEAMMSTEADVFYETPQFLTLPIFLGLSGHSFSSSVACRDTNNYRLYYEMIVPRQAVESTVKDYLLPENFMLNQFNGLITWDTKFKDLHAVGEFAFAVKVKQVNDADELIGYVTRDFQIILNETDFSGSFSDNKTLDANNRIYVSENSEFQFKVLAIGEDVESVSMNLQSELFGYENALGVDIYDSLSGDQKIKVGVISIESSAELIRENPYVVNVRMGLEKSGNIYFQDANYLIYTKDVELEEWVEPEEPPILSSEEVSLPLSVYPNPITDFVYSVGNENKGAAQVSDPEGRTLIRSDLTENKIDLSALKTGVYFIRINVPGKAGKTIKVVKK
jgi:hypothetical protein